MLMKGENASMVSRKIYDALMKQQILGVMLFICLVPSFSHSSDLKAYVSPEPKRDSWWLRITFEPAHKELYGILIRKIDPTWLFASQLQKEAIPHDVLFEDGQDSMARRGMNFMQKGDFNNDGIEEIALVGVFQNTKHQYGNFFLILTKKKDGSWKKEFLRSWIGQSGFLGLSGNGHGVTLSFCMDCGGFSEIRWDKNLKSYILLKAADEE